MIKLGKYIALLLLLGGALGTTLFLVFNNDSSENDYVNVIPDALSVNEGELFDLAIDSNLDLSALNIVSSNLSTVRLEGSQLKALRGGTVTLTVESQDGRVQDHVLITVNPLVSEEPAEDPSFEVVLEGERFTFNEPIPVSQLDAPLLEGYTFMGFSLEENGEVLENDTVIDESLTLYSIYEAIEEETPEPPVVDDEDSEDEDESGEDSETPMDEDEEPITVSSPSSITITLESDQGITMSVLTVSPGSIISAGAFDGELSEVGYFLKGETCENPFDFDTPLVTDTSIVFGETNYTSPCIELDEMATLGKLQVGETIQAFVSPSAATVTYEWFISANDRDYSLLRNITGSTLELAPEHFRQYIAVKLTGTGDYTGSLSLPLRRVGLSSRTVDSEDTGGSGGTGGSSGSSCTLIPINTTSAFLNIEFDGCYELTADIDLSGLGTLTQSAFDYVSFMGTLDGNGHVISGLSMSSTGDNGLGLFTQLTEATVRNITLSAFNITGTRSVGTLTSNANNNSLIENVDIINSSLNSTLDASFTAVGGLAGRLSKSEVKNVQIINTTLVNNSNEARPVGGAVGEVYTNSTLQSIQVNGVVINGAKKVGGLIGETRIGVHLSTILVNNVTIYGDDWAGGIIGWAYNDVKIINATFDGNISSSGQYVGGIAGALEDQSRIEQSSNHGSVSSSTQYSYVGGLVGRLKDSEIENSYNMGAVSGDEGVGGLVGLTSQDISQSRIYHSYSASNVTGNAEIGSIIGKHNSDIELTHLYWNTDISSANPVGLVNINRDITGNTTVTGITNGAMQDIQTFTNASWDIGNSLNDEKIWTIGYEGANTFPWLSWQEEPNDSSTLNILSLGYIPIASLEDFEAIDSSSSRTFAAGTPYAYETTGGLNKKYILVNDIDLSGYNDTTAVIDDTFIGTLDGNGQKISGLEIDDPDGNSLGLFRQLGDSIIRDLVMDDIFISGNYYNGALAGLVNPGEVVLENISLSNITVSGVGGTNVKHGGLIGYVHESSITMTSISFSGHVSGKGQTGGLIGHIDDSAVYLDGLSSDIQISLSGESGGGLYGEVSLISSAILKNIDADTKLISTGEEASSGQYVGGIIGKVNSNTATVLVENLVLNSTITSTGFTGDADVGGVIGYINGSNLITFKNIVHIGSVNSTGGRVGGLIGYISSNNTITLSSITHNGIISGNERVGGLIGDTTGIINGNDINITNTGITHDTDDFKGTIIGYIRAAGIVNLTSIDDGVNDGDDYVGNDAAGHAFEDGKISK